MEDLKTSYPQFSKAKILYIEDEQVINEMCTSIFSLFVDSITSVINCQEALDILNTDDTEYDIIIVDLLTPKLNGFDFIKEVRKFDRKVKICVVTARQLSQVKKDINENDIDGIFQKPVRIEALISYLEDLL